MQLVPRTGLGVCTILTEPSAFVVTYFIYIHTLLASRCRNATTPSPLPPSLPSVSHRLRGNFPAVIVSHKPHHFPDALTLTGEAPSLGGYLENIPSMSWLALVDENAAASHTTTVRAGASVACRVCVAFCNRTRHQRERTRERKEKERRGVKARPRPRAAVFPRCLLLPVTLIEVFKIAHSMRS